MGRRAELQSPWDLVRKPPYPEHRVRVRCALARPGLCPSAQVVPGWFWVCEVSAHHPQGDRKRVATREKTRRRRGMMAAFKCLKGEKSARSGY